MPDAPLQTLVDELSEELGRPVLLDDAELRPVAYSPQWGELDAVRTGSILARGVPEAVRDALFGHGIATASGVVAVPAAPELGMRERLCAPVRRHGRVVGYVWLLGTPLGAQEAERVVAAAAHAAELLGDEDEAPLVAALSGTDAAARAEAARRIRAEGRLAAGRVLVLAVDGPAGAVRALARRLSAGHALAGRGVLLVALGDPALARVPPAEVAAHLHGLGGGRVAVGQSAPLAELEGAHDGLRQARLALAAALRGPGHAAWEGLGADRLVARLPPDALADVPDALARTIREHPVLAQTVAAFLDAAGDVKRTATALALHRSGLYYRLRRFEELTGLSFDDGDDRLLVHLALRASALDNRSVDSRRVSIPEGDGPA